LRAAARLRSILPATLVLTLISSACNQSEEIRTQALDDSQAVTFASADGVRLAGRVFGPDDATAGVVLAHMLPADQSSWFDFADRVGELGYRVLTFDFRGYCPGGDAGCSQGTKQVSAIWQDVQGAVDYLEDEGVLRIGLVGASMGGTASLVVGSRADEAIRAVVTLSAPASIDGLVAGPDILAATTAAKLFIAGNGDGVAADSAQRFYDQSAPPKRVEILTTADHGTDVLEGNQGEVARALIVGWLGQYVPIA
jgi:pimeloyl-ACP methyl ester carboxylesterase